MNYDQPWGWVQQKPQQQNNSVAPLGGAGVDGNPGIVQAGPSNADQALGNLRGIAVKKGTDELSKYLDTAIKEKMAGGAASSAAGTVAPLGSSATQTATNAALDSAYIDMANSTTSGVATDAAAGVVTDTATSGAVGSVAPYAGAGVAAAKGNYGQAAGSAVGTAVGSAYFGPIGGAVGGAIGGAVGSYAGNALGFANGTESVQGFANGGTNVVHDGAGQSEPVPFVGGDATGIGPDGLPQTGGNIPLTTATPDSVVPGTNVTLPEAAANPAAVGKGVGAGQAGGKAAIPGTGQGAPQYDWNPSGAGYYGELKNMYNPVVSARMQLARDPANPWGGTTYIPPSFSFSNNPPLSGDAGAGTGADGSSGAVTGGPGDGGNGNSGDSSGGVGGTGNGPGAAGTSSGAVGGPSDGSANGDGSGVGSSPSDGDGTAYNNGTTFVGGNRRRMQMANQPVDPRFQRDLAQVQQRKFVGNPYAGMSMEQKRAAQAAETAANGGPRTNRPVSYRDRQQAEQEAKTQAFLHRMVQARTDGGVFGQTVGEHTFQVQGPTEDQIQRQANLADQQATQGYTEADKLAAQQANNSRGNLGQPAVRGGK